MKIEKRNGIRKGILAAVCLGLALLTGACATGKNKVPVIGIAQYGEHGSLDNCREGFLQGLAKAGLQEGKDYTLDVQNASSDDAVNNQIAQKFSDENAALMVGIATPSAQACFNAAEEKDIPVIFTAVTDPVGAKLDQGNVTGTSDVLPVEGQLKLIRKLQPEARTVGILYTTSEANSLYAIAQYQQLAGDYGFTIDAVAVTTQSEVTQALDKLLSDGAFCRQSWKKPMRQAFRCMAPRSNRLSWDASPERGLIMSSSESRPAKWPPGSCGGRLPAGISPMPALRTTTCTSTQKH